MLRYRVKSYMRNKTYNGDQHHNPNWPPSSTRGCTCRSFVFLISLFRRLDVIIKAMLLLLVCCRAGSRPTSFKEEGHNGGAVPYAMTRNRAGEGTRSSLGSASSGALEGGGSNCSGFTTGVLCFPCKIINYSQSDLPVRNWWYCTLLCLELCKTRDYKPATTAICFTLVQWRRQREGALKNPQPQHPPPFFTWKKNPAMPHINCAPCVTFIFTLSAPPNALRLVLVRTAAKEKNKLKKSLESLYCVTQLSTNSKQMWSYINAVTSRIESFKQHSLYLATGFTTNSIPTAPASYLYEQA